MRCLQVEQTSQQVETSTGGTVAHRVSDHAASPTSAAEVQELRRSFQKAGNAALGNSVGALQTAPDVASQQHSEAHAEDPVGVAAAGSVSTQMPAAGRLPLPRPPAHMIEAQGTNQYRLREWYTTI